MRNYRPNLSQSEPDGESLLHLHMQELKGRLEFTCVLWTGTISHPLSVCTPSSGIPRATWSAPNVMGGAMSYSCWYFLLTIWSSNHVNSNLPFQTNYLKLCTYCEAHLQVFGNHKMAVVPVVLQVFNCEIDLSTILTGVLARCHFFHYSNPRKVGSGEYSILTAKTEWPSIYDIKLVWKGFLGTASADKA